MFYWLVEWLSRSYDVGVFNVFRWIEFRCVMAVLFAFVGVVWMGPPIIGYLARQKVGDMPEFHNASINELMKHKENTPTMGGLFIVTSIVITCILLGDLSRETGFYLWMGLVCLLAHAAIGIADDWLKLTYGRRQRAAFQAGGERAKKQITRDGLKSWEKLTCQLGLALILAIFMYRAAGKYYEDPAPTVTNIVSATEESPADAQDIAVSTNRDMALSLNLPGMKSWKAVTRPSHNDSDIKVTSFVPYVVRLPMALFVMWAVITIAGMSNAVNLTDGMDGLAGGVSVIVCLGLVILCVFAGYTNPDNGSKLAQTLLLPHVPDSDELAVLGGAMAGACLGFLWFNANPAQVFMGDTGSLALGGTMGFIAMVIRQEILLFIMGGVFILEAVSVFMQVGYFKLSKGKRIFKCAPIHHHFQMDGWPEQRIVTRAYVVTVLLAALALALIKVR